MNRADYVSQLDDRRKGIPDSKYLDYLWGNRDTADLESTICIQIAAYCDPELITTIRACIENAANPDRIHFAICHQSDDEAELEKLLAFKNCKVTHFSKADAPGTCAARYECNKLIADEDYVMHFDSHMRFAPFWDTCLIQQWVDCDDPKAIITAYGVDYAGLVDEPITMSDKFVPRGVDGRIMNAKHFEDYTIKVRPYSGRRMPAHSTKPRLGAFVSAHFTLAKAELDKEVPFDPKMYFVGDEISMAVRYWTHGYNIYHPAFRCVYHLYHRIKAMKDAHGVKIERVNKSINDHGRSREILRMEQLFRICDHGYDLTGFDLGKERSIEEYQAFAGINFKDKVILKFSYNGFFDVPHSDFDLKPCNWQLKYEADYGVAHKADLLKRTILVMIPSYKDSHLMLTIKSFRDNADNPDRIHFAVCYQDDDMEMLKELQNIEHCKVIHMSPQDAIGVGHAYHLLESTLGNEDYVLCTDSHTYAVNGWDSYMINEIDELGDKAIISNWLVDCDKNETLPTDPVKLSRRIGLFRISDMYLFKTRRTGARVNTNHARGAFVAGNNVFGCAQFIKDCKHDPYMLMNSVDTAYTLSLWTHGYDVYHSKWHYLYHYVSAGDSNARRSINEQKRDEEKAISVPRLKRYMGIIDNSTIDIDLGEYAPGTSRSVKAFEQFAGIDYRNKKVSLRSILADFTNDGVVDEYVDSSELDAFIKNHNINLAYLADLNESLSKYELPGITYLK